MSEFIRVTGKEEARHYAPKIAWNARNNSHMPLLCTGPPAINVAIKVRHAPALPCQVPRLRSGTVRGHLSGGGPKCSRIPLMSAASSAGAAAWAGRADQSAFLSFLAAAWAGTLGCRLWPLHGSCWRTTPWSSLCSRPSETGGWEVPAVPLYRTIMLSPRLDAPASVG